MKAVSEVEQMAKAKAEFGGLKQSEMFIATAARMKVEIELSKALRKADRAVR